MIEIICEQINSGKSQEIFEKLGKITALALHRENIDINSDIIYQISLTLADEDEIKELNNEHRGKNNITDVLSFPQFNDITEIKQYGMRKEGFSRDLLLGDVVICQEVANKQAIEYGHSYEREFLYLFTHSVFHLLGYDHIDDDDKIIMREKEKSILKELNILR